MSLSFLAVKKPTVQLVLAFGDVSPRSPASMVLVTTCSIGGSPAIAFGSLQGRSGSAHPSSIDVGARLPSL